MKLKSIVLGTTTILIVTVLGCGKEPAAESPAVSIENMPAIDKIQPSILISQSDLDGVTKADKPYKITLIVKTRNNPFFDPMIKAFEAECKSLGVDGNVQAPPQETDKEIQFSTIQNVAAKGADAILIAPADSKAVIPALKMATERKILVINIDNRVDKTSASEQKLDMGGYVGADNEAGGKLAGDAMVAALPVGGKVAIIEGIRGADNAEARKRGFEKGVEGKLTVVSRETANWKMDEANSKAQAIIAANGDLSGIFCANDMMAIGAMKAVKDAGKSGKIKVIGYDNIPDVQSYIKSGAMSASVEQHPDLMGKYGLRMAVGILNGKVSKGKEFLVPLEAKGK